MHPDQETLVVFGGAVKALDDAGRIGGHLVLFGSPDQTDASQLRDFFTPETDFGLDVTTKSRVYYQHAQDPELKDKTLGLAPGSMKADKVGVWVETQLDLRDKYELAIYGMVKDGKLGWSSGTAPHVIKRQKQPNGSNKICTWPLGLDASLTPTPAETRTAAVALKSLALDGSALKGALLGTLAEPAAAMSAVRTLMDRLSSFAWDTMADEKRPPAERIAAIAAGFDEFRATSLRLIEPLLAGGSPADGGAVKRLQDRLLDDQFLLIQARAAGIEV